MEIKPIPVNVDANGNPAVDFAVYIGRPFTDPRVEDNKLVVKNGMDGKNVSNPFYISSSGFFRNISGQVISPVIAETAYCVEFRGPNDNLLYRNKNVISDAISSPIIPGGSDIVGAVIDNFLLAKTMNLSDFSTIYIQSYAGSWAATASGPVGDFFAYRTGSSGAPSTGNPGSFFDAAGNEWKPLLSQRLYAEMFGAVSGIGNDSFQAIQDMFNAAADRNTPCYLDGKDYYISTQANVAPAYSLITKYAISIPTRLEVYGAGDTSIINANANNSQFMFFGEDVDSLIMKGLRINAQSTMADTGAMYLAGCLEADLDLTISNSTSLYLSSSTTRQTDRVKLAAFFDNSVGYAVSGNSGGFKQLYLERFMLDACDDGIDITNKDIDGFGLTLTAPKVTVPFVDGNVNNSLFNIVLGDLVFGTINADAQTVFDINLDVEHINLIQGDSINSICNTVISSTASNGGLLKKFLVDSIFAPDCTNAFIFDSPDQLIEDVIVQFSAIKGSGTALTLGDNSQNGNIQFLGGRWENFADGIIINQTNGQNIFMRGVKFENITTKITGSTKSLLDIIAREFVGAVDAVSAWDSLPVLDWTLSGVGGIGGYTEVTHNLGHDNYTVEATCYGNMETAAAVANKGINSFRMAVRLPGASYTVRGDINFTLKSAW